VNESVIINEVGLRDGLQNQPVLVATADKARLAQSLIAAGVRHFEPVSFAHPKAVPQMADAAELAELLPKDGAADASALHDTALYYTAMVPNLKGYLRAKACGFKRVALLLSTTDSFNQRNLKMSRDDALQSCRDIIDQARLDGIATRAYVAGALACPYDGYIAPTQTLALAEQLFAAGADEVGIADTIGGGHPQQLQQVLRPLVREHGSDALIVHLHDTRGLALAMAWAACELGIRRFDASIAGLGGCPFAPGATGNVATEDLVYLFERSGLSTGISLEKLRHSAALANQLTWGTNGSGASNEDRPHNQAKIMQWTQSQMQRGKSINLDLIQ
jgi:hydroxymethylglutaryl-CoA lyase